jgi:H+-transporting ATPase
MIGLLAILNDLPIITIAYDNVRYSNNPEKWSMRVIVGMATLLGVLGVIESFGLFYIGCVGAVACGYPVLYVS